MFQFYMQDIFSTVEVIETIAFIIASKLNVISALCNPGSNPAPIPKTVDLSPGMAIG